MKMYVNVNYISLLFNSDPWFYVNCWTILNSWKMQAVNFDGGYKYQYGTSNGIAQQESGIAGKS